MDRNSRKPQRVGAKNQISKSQPNQSTPVQKITNGAKKRALVNSDTKQRGVENKQLKKVSRPTSRTADRKPAGSAVSRTTKGITPIRNKETLIESNQDNTTEAQGANLKQEKVSKIRALPSRGRLPKIETTAVPRAKSPEIARINAIEGNNLGSSKSISKDFEIDRASGRILTTKRSNQLPKLETKKSTGVISVVEVQGVLKSDLNLVELKKDASKVNGIESDKLSTKKSSQKTASKDATKKISGIVSTESKSKRKKRSIDSKVSGEGSKQSKVYIKPVPTASNATNISAGRTHRLRSVSESSLDESDTEEGVLNRLSLYQELEYQRQSHQKLSRQHIAIDAKIGEISENNKAEMNQIQYNRRILKFDNQSILNKLETMDKEIYTYYNRRVEIHNAEQQLRERAMKVPFADYKLEKLHHKKRKWSEDYAKKEATVELLEQQLFEKAIIIQQQRALLERATNPQTFKERFQNFIRKGKVFFGCDKFSSAMLQQ
ncbi:uncharacterized protein [Clytia hemisphaerica]|uniref:Uncharacterized protein n=1 Tax=Clytia hemisphaerica TaxID=252671 RepID=A0A7M5UTE7_9CNID